MRLCAWTSLHAGTLLHFEDQAAVVPLQLLGVHKPAGAHQKRKRAPVRAMTVSSGFHNARKCGGVQQCEGRGIVLQLQSQSPESWHEENIPRS